MSGHFFYTFGLLGSHLQYVVPYFRKMVLCGALTDGQDWIFLLLKFNDNYAGAKYMHSSTIKLRPAQSLDGHVTVPPPWPDIVAGILSHWVSFILLCAKLMVERYNDVRLRVVLLILTVMTGLITLMYFSILIVIHFLVLMSVVNNVQLQNMTSGTPPQNLVLTVH